MKQKLSCQFLLGTVSFLLLLQGNVFAQNSQEYITFEERVFSDNIKTVMLLPEKAEMSLPILELNSPEKLLLSFDELAETANNYRYKIQHCSADWGPSELQVHQYINGIEDMAISNQQFSFNTVQRYVHYSETIPNDMMSFKVSGNYLLTVYLDGKPENPVFTRRFRIREQEAGIRGTVKVSSDVQFRTEKQELEIEVVVPERTFWVDPENNLKVYLQQNQRRDMMQKLKLHGTRGNSYNYVWEDVNQFYGGNEFRNLDVKNIRIRSSNVERNEFIEGEVHLYLMPDKNRFQFPYSYDQDLNGRFKIYSTDASVNNNIEADYAWLHFVYPVDAPRLDGTFHIVGGITDWHVDESSEMQFLPNINAYSASFYVKQGYYNYLILFKQSGSLEANARYTEGNYVETENDYTTYVYYRKPGDTYDRLIGVATFNSRSGK